MDMAGDQEGYRMNANSREFGPELLLYPSVLISGKVFLSPVLLL
jgi:hypothetical protein